MLVVTITEFNLPLTEITWFIDDTPATDMNSRVNITTTSTASPLAISTLTLDPIQFSAESGLYSVTVVNPAGMDNTAFDVTVYCKIERSNTLFRLFIIPQHLLTSFTPLFLLT